MVQGREGRPPPALIQLRPERRMANREEDRPFQMEVFVCVPRGGSDRCTEPTLALNPSLYSSLSMESGPAGGEIKALRGLGGKERTGYENRLFDALQKVQIDLTGGTEGLPKAVTLKTEQESKVNESSSLWRREGQRKNHLRGNTLAWKEIYGKDPKEYIKYYLCIFICGTVGHRN